MKKEEKNILLLVLIIIILAVLYLIGWERVKAIFLMTVAVLFGTGVIIGLVLVILLIRREMKK